MNNAFVNKYYIYKISNKSDLSVNIFIYIIIAHFLKCKCSLFNSNPKHAY